MLRFATVSDNYLPLPLCSDLFCFSKIHVTIEFILRCGVFNTYPVSSIIYLEKQLDNIELISIRLDVILSTKIINNYDRAVNLQSI